ncbi:flagellin [Alsobacter sp. SYSU M60028]|uniref:Flagellin n=1 Tax=Alsobacter ponti TaxID=2962936 RepID=A0ABT1L7G1_9HYPH|nr:flagellin [Alsobacter ponti]MCP8937299.1 flagellin [Alsobacter ponti]
MTVLWPTAASVSQDSVRTRQTASMFTQLRGTAEDLQRQLSTGQVADTWAGLGADRFRSLDLRARLANFDTWSDTISRTQTRLTLIDQFIGQIDKNRTSLRNELSPSGPVFLSSNQTVGQDIARSRLSEAIDMLNQQVDGVYFFAGRASDTKPVLPMATLLDGVGAQAGLRTLIDERRQADLGTGTGRLATSIAGATVSVTEDAAPFGMKLASVTSNLANATTTAPAGAPPSASVTLAGDPRDGDTLTFTFNLPDGGTTDIVLTARTTDNPGVGDDFAIGATPADTAANLKAALDTQIARKAATALSAASAMATARDFFRTDGTAPTRVVGPPFASATATTAGTAADTVIWYRGDTSADPRATTTARVDEGQPVGVGGQANEPAFAETLAQLAVLATETYPSSDANRVERYGEMVARAKAPAGAQTLQEIQQDFGIASARVATAKARNRDTQGTLKDALSGIEQPDTNTVVAALLSVQNRLQASYETTSMLSKMSLVNYLG